MRKLLFLPLLLIGLVGACQTSGLDSALNAVIDQRIALHTSADTSKQVTTIGAVKAFADTMYLPAPNTYGTYLIIMECENTGNMDVGNGIDQVLLKNQNGVYSIAVTKVVTPAFGQSSIAAPVWVPVMSGKNAVIQVTGIKNVTMRWKITRTMLTCGNL